MRSIINVMSEQDTLRLVLYIPAVPSIQHMVNVARNLRQDNKVLPPGRIAVIYQASLQLSLLNMIARSTVRSSTLRLFPLKEEQQALTWLAE